MRRRSADHVRGLRSGGGCAAGADRRPVRHRKRRARPLSRARNRPKSSGPFIFKASFDKANRSSVDSYRGPGIEGRPAHSERPCATPDSRCSPTFTSPAQAAAAAEAVDILQIPAFLCRQTDLLMAAGRTGRVVNIKKGQFVVAARYSPRGGESGGRGQRSHSAHRARQFVRL